MTETTTEHPTTTTPPPKVGPGEPGYAFGLAGFISSFIWGVAGIVLSAIGLVQSKRIGKRNTFALAGLIIGIVQTVVTALAITGAIIGVFWVANYCNAHPISCSDNSNSGGSYYYPQQNSAQPDQTY